jgi:RNA 3'-terminal phosphate cyclase
VLEIDGSEKSGSGTIVRVALSLAALLEREVRVVNIRTRRPKAAPAPPPWWR